MLYRIICKYEYTDQFLELTIFNPLDDEKSSNSSTHRPCRHRQMVLETHVCIAGQIHRQIYQILFSLSEPARVTNVRSQSMWYVYEGQGRGHRVRVSEYHDQGRIRVRYGMVR